MVTDTGGINDKSFNQSAWQGMQEAAAANPNITVKYLQSTTQSDYVPNINTFLSEKCGIIVTVGFLMAAATESAAKANPSQDFAIVDCSYASECLTGAKESNIDQLVVQHRAGRLPRRLPGRGHEQDRQGRHVRR